MANKTLHKEKAESSESSLFRMAFHSCYWSLCFSLHNRRRTV